MKKLINSKINLAVADDHLLFRQGLTSLLAFSDDLNLCADVSNGEELLEVLRNEPVDVVLLDIQMPIMDGYDTLKRMQVEFPEVRVLILTMGIQNEQVRKVIDLGAYGILLKDQEFEAICDAIHSAYHRKYYFNERISNELVRDLMDSDRLRTNFNAVSLSDREVEIINLICREYTNKEISDRLSISTRTVEGHRERILLKIQAKNVAGIVMYAVKNNILA